MRGGRPAVLVGVLVSLGGCALLADYGFDSYMGTGGGLGGMTSGTGGSCDTAASSGGTCQACESPCDCTCPPNPWCYESAYCLVDGGECVYIPGMDGTTCCYSLGTCSGGTCSLTTIDPGLSCTHSCACSIGTASTSGCCCSTSGTCDDTDTCLATGGTCQQ
jgi:hypothetical protein